MNYYQANLDAIKYRSDHFYELLLSQPTQKKLKKSEENGDAEHTLNMLKKHEDAGVVVLMGFGEGDLASKALKELGKGFALVIYEFDLPRFNGILTTKDFSEIWRDERVVLILERGEGFGFLEYLRKYIIGGRLWMLLNPSTKKLKKEYEKKCNEIAKNKALFEVNVGTQIGMGKNFMNSFLENIPQIIEREGVSSLKNRFKDLPCVVISPGPSLKKDIEHLKAHRDEAIYLAVDSVTPFLMEHDFLPDFICGIDPMPDNKVLFSDPRLKDVPLIAIMQYTPEVLRTYPGRIFVSSQYGNQIYGWLGQHWEDRGVIECPGGSVSHFGLAIAEYFGCEPISIIGQDLCFKDEYYCNDVGKLLDSTVSDTHHIDRKEGSISIKNMYGEEVSTTGIFVAFKMWFDNKFKAMKKQGKRVFNLSDGGLSFDGTTEMKFLDFIKKHGKQIESLDVEKIELKSNKDMLIREMIEGYKLVLEIAKVSREIIPILHEINTFIPSRNKEEINSRVNKIIELKPRTQHFFLHVIYAYHFQIQLYLDRYTVREVDNIPDKFECLTAQTDKGINYYGELVEACELFALQLDKVLNSFGITEHKENKDG
jgi:hypothetical protein